MSNPFHSSLPHRMVLAGAAGALLFALAMSVTGRLDSLETTALEGWMALRPPPSQPSPVTVVVLRGERFDSGHRSARTHLADLLETLAAQPESQRPAAVVVDLVLALEAEGDAGQAVIDRILKAQQTLGTVVHALTFAMRDTEFMDVPRPLEFLEPHAVSPAGFTTTAAYGARLAHPTFQTELYRSAAAVGFVNISPQTDGLETALHALPLLIQLPFPTTVKGKHDAQQSQTHTSIVLPSLGLAGAAVALCHKRPLKDCLKPGPQGLHIAGSLSRDIPLDHASGYYRVNHHKRFQAAQVPEQWATTTPEVLLFHSVSPPVESVQRVESPFSTPELQTPISPTVLAGRTLLVVDGHEPRTVLGPFDDRYPQAAIHAQVMANLLEADYLRRASTTLWTVAALLPLLVSLGWSLGRRNRTVVPPMSNGSPLPTWRLEPLRRALRYGVTTPELGVGVMWTAVAGGAFVLESLWLPVAAPGVLLLGSVLGRHLSLPFLLHREGEKLERLLEQREALIQTLQTQATTLAEERLALQESLPLSETAPSDISASSSNLLTDALLPDTEAQALDRLLNESLELVSRMDPSGSSGHSSGHSPQTGLTERLRERLRASRDAVAETRAALATVEASLQGLKPTGAEYQRQIQARLQAHQQLLEHSRSAFRELVGELVRIQTPVLEGETLPLVPTSLQQALIDETGILTRDPQLLRLLAEVTTRIARSESPVLIQGETGTGKELIARTLHQHSPRSKRPLVTLNCAAVSAGVMESELFGHVKGAFTGAARDHNGAFVDADGGTLFLDELGEMPLEMQARLLRALEYGEIQPVGGDHGTRRKVNVRIITATHADLLEKVAQRTFREDLYFRINTLVVELPPLRERQGDVEMLAQHFLKLEGEILQKSFVLQPEALRLLQVGHPWPGNVRELRASIRRLATLADTDQITAGEVKRHLHFGTGFGNNRTPGSRSEHLLFDAEEREKLALQRQHQFSATRCEQDARYGGGRQTASRHLRVWMSKALWWSGWEVSAALQLLAAGDEALVEILRPSLETFLNNLRERLAQEKWRDDGTDSSLYKSLKTHYRADLEHLWRVVLALQEGWLRG